LFAGRQAVEKTVRETVRMRLVELLVRSDSSRFARKANRDSAMATEGRRKKSKAEKLAEMDRELADIRAEIEKLELRMRQDEELVQVCEPETGKGLDDDEEDELGSSDDLKNCQEGRKKKFQIAKRATN
jgi:hypothetical protein